MSAGTTPVHLLRQHTEDVSYVVPIEALLICFFFLLNIFSSEQRELEKEDSFLCSNEGRVLAL